MKFRFSEEKNDKLIAERGIGFQEIIEKGKVLSSSSHPNQERYPNQYIYYIEVNDEIYVVPYVVEDDKTLFLKTIFPSRKARKKLLK